MTDMSDDPQPYNPGHQVEGLDRCHNLMLLIDDTLADHPAVIKAGAQGLVEAAVAQLTEAYLMIGRLDDTENMLPREGDTHLLREALNLLEFVTWHDGRYHQETHAGFQRDAQQLVIRIAERFEVAPYQSQKESKGSSQ